MYKKKKKFEEALKSYLPAKVIKQKYDYNGKIRNSNLKCIKAKKQRDRNKTVIIINPYKIN